MAPSMMVLVPTTALQHTAAEPLALGGLKQQQQADEELEAEPPASGGQQQQADEELEAEPPALGGQQQADKELEAEQPASGGQQQQAAAAAELVTMVSHIADCD
jgi:general stress protein YciG